MNHDCFFTASAIQDDHYIVFDNFAVIAWHLKEVLHSPILIKSLNKTGRATTQKTTAWVFSKIQRSNTQSRSSKPILLPFQGSTLLLIDVRSNDFQILMCQSNPFVQINESVKKYFQIIHSHSFGNHVLSVFVLVSNLLCGLYQMPGVVVLRNRASCVILQCRKYCHDIQCLSSWFASIFCTQDVTHDAQFRRGTLHREEAWSSSCMYHTSSVILCATSSSISLRQETVLVDRSGKRSFYSQHCWTDFVGSPSVCL